MNERYHKEETKKKIIRKRNVEKEVSADFICVYYWNVRFFVIFFHSNYRHSKLLPCYRDNLSYSIYFLKIMTQYDFFLHFFKG